MVNRVYMWNPKKRTHKQHIQGPDGKTLCLLENGSKVNRVTSEVADPKRKICRICIHLEETGKRERKRHKTGMKTKRKSVDHFLLSREWQELRYRALKMSNGRCQCCGARAEDGRQLNVDHIKPRHKYPELALTLGNLQVLCAQCNAGKGGWDETDWREPRLRVLMGEEID